MEITGLRAFGEGAVTRENPSQSEVQRPTSTSKCLMLFHRAHLALHRRERGEAGGASRFVGPSPYPTRISIYCLPGRASGTTMLSFVGSQNAAHAAISARRFSSASPRR